MKLNRLQIIQLPLMAVLLAVLVTVNVVLGVYKEVITGLLVGSVSDVPTLDYTDGNQICEDIAAEGIVLLRNEDDALPLKAKNTSKKIPVSVFGWGATDGGFITSGAGSGSSAERGAGKLVTFLEALEGKGALLNTDGEGNVVYDDEGKPEELMPEVKGKFEYFKPLIEMYEKYKAKRSTENYWGEAYPFFNLIEPAYSKVEPLMSEAREFSPTAIVVISRVGGEGQDMPRRQVKLNPDTDNAGNYDTTTDTERTYLQISKEEEDMLKGVRKTFNKVIVIINSCNAMDLSFLEKYKVDAALSVGGTGQAGTVAIAKILNGEINPSGKTVDTYAYDHSTAATYVNAPDCRQFNGETGGVKTYTDSDEAYIDYAEGIYVGYKWYETADEEQFWDSDFAKELWDIENGYEDVVQYPFGFGLSYTTFEWNIEEWQIDGKEARSNSTITGESKITVKVRVSNVGNLPGKDVVQIYYTPPYYKNGIEKSSVNLIAFAKTELLDKQGGEKDSQLLTITFNASDMKSFDCYGLNENSKEGYILEQGDYEISVRTTAHDIYDGGNSTIKYKVKKDIPLNHDDDKVENIFTGDKDGDISIDGSTTGADILYLKRSDIENTFLTAPQERREKDGRIIGDAESVIENLSFREFNQEPITGSYNALTLYVDETDDEGNKETILNKDLVFALGKNYDDYRWEFLLNQLTKAELKDLVLKGGYKTNAIRSLNKPEHQDLDGPSGLNREDAANSSSRWTSFPVETVLAQSWNARLSYVFGLAVGNEAYNTEVSGWYAPACNIHRSPFDGRNFEYYSEDSYLSGVMCAETVRGATNTGLYCYVKHFAVNETEFYRKSVYTWLTEQALREIYLRPFEIAVKEGEANAIMSSYNRVGAVWAGGSYKLLTTVLRKEWGFKGSVITDYVDENAGGYMNADQMLRAGGDFVLDGQKTTAFVGHDDLDNYTATSLNLSREAAHNILYTFCNTAYRQNEFSSYGDPEDADKFATETGNKKASNAAPYWKIWGWLPLDFIGFGGLMLWIYLCFIHDLIMKKKFPLKKGTATSETLNGADEQPSASNE